MYICIMLPGIVTHIAGAPSLSLKVTRELKQLVNISIAAGKFILIHPDYELIREAMRMELFEDEKLEDFEVHNWQFEVGETITYDMDEILFFYTLLELNCRMFICSVGDDLKKMAVENGETTPEEFIRVRSSHLRQAQLYIHFIREQFEDAVAFRNIQRKLEQLNAIAD
jgi:hypothetical protein